MEHKGISKGQYGALLWAGALAPVVELLPAVTLPVAKKGAWLAPLVAAVVLLPFFFKVRKLGGSILGAKTQLGNVVGSGFLLVYLLWLELLLTLRLGLCARRMVLSGERDGSVWFFLLVLAALAGWMAGGTLPAFGRAGQLYLTVLVLTGGLVLGLSLPQLRIDRLLPLWKEDVLPVLQAGVPAAAALLWSILPMLCLPPEEPDGKGGMLFWGVGGCLVLGGMQAILLGNLGTALAGRSEYAFFTLTKSVGVEGAFQRVESVVAALWLLCDLTLCVTLLFALGRLGGILFPGIRPKWTVWGALSIALWGAWVWCGRGELLEVWNQSWVLAGNLALGFGGTTFLYLGGLLRKKMGRSSIFSSRNTGKKG